MSKAIIYLIFSLVVIIVSSVALGVFSRFFHGRYNKAMNKWNTTDNTYSNLHRPDESDLWFPVGIAGLAYVILLAFVVPLFVSSLIVAINPEYEALRSILGAIGNAT